MKMGIYSIFFFFICFLFSGAENGESIWSKRFYSLFLFECACSLSFDVQPAILKYIIYNTLHLNVRFFVKMFLFFFWIFNIHSHGIAKMFTDRSPSIWTKPTSIHFLSPAINYILVNLVNFQIYRLFEKLGFIFCAIMDSTLWP